MTDQTVTIALLTAGAPTFPDEGYAMIPLEFGSLATVGFVLEKIKAEMAEPLDFLKMLMADSPAGCIRGWVITDYPGLRLICETLLREAGITVERVG